MMHNFADWNYHIKVCITIISKCLHLFMALCIWRGALV